MARVLPQDSQGICFLGQLDYDAFLRGHLGERRGEARNSEEGGGRRGAIGRGDVSRPARPLPSQVREFETGEIIGEHRGLWYHTVGQRRGVGPALGPRHVSRRGTARVASRVASRRRAATYADLPLLCPAPPSKRGQISRGPWYVVRKEMDSNVLFVSREYASADKPRNAFHADAINWIGGAPPPAGAAGEPTPLRVKVRHGAASHEASVSLLDGGARAHVSLAGRDKGLAPGQFAAFYDGPVCLGSGVISEEGL